jgi:hypothetical protein
MFEGADGMIRVDNMGQNFAVIPQRLKPTPAVKGDKYHSGADHVRNFLECVKSRSEPTAPVEIGHRSASLCHLGNIAIALQKKLRWDPAAEKFTGSGSDEANKLLAREAREPWSV